MTESSAKAATLGVRAGPDLLRRVDDMAMRAGLTRSEVVRLALVRLDQAGLTNLDAETLRAARGMD